MPAGRARQGAPTRSGGGAMMVVGPKRVVEEMWFARLMNWLRSWFGPGASSRIKGEEDATDDYPTPTAFMLSAGGLKLRVGVISTVGYHREHNEDNFYVPGRNSVRFDEPGRDGTPPSRMSHALPEGSTEFEASSFEAGDSSNLLFIVADGMGGQQAGEQASKMAVELIPKAIAKRSRTGIGADSRAVQGLVREAIAEVNQEILGCSAAIPEYANMGTTVVLALFRNDRVFVTGIGDSRAYRLRGGRLERMTKDHSLADALGEAGTISPEEIPHHKFKNVLYLYLGSKDARGGPEVVQALDVLPGDRFLLASDGLTGVVGDEELKRVLQTCEDAQRAARVLVDQALANDSKDNITSLVIHVVNEAEQPTP
jgi:protein phosphatase